MASMLSCVEMISVNQSLPIGFWKFGEANAEMESSSDLKWVTITQIQRTLFERTLKSQSLEAVD